MNSKNKEHKSYLTWLFHHLLKQKFLLISVIFGIILATLTSTLIPLILGDIIDATITINDINQILPLIFIAFFLYISNIVLDYGSMMIGHFLGLKIEKNMRTEFFDVIQSKPLKFHDSTRTGDLQALATYDLRIVNTMISHGAFYIYPFIQVGLVIFLLFDILDIRLALFFIPFLVLYIYFIVNYRKNLAPFVAARMEKHSNIAVVLQDNISGSAVIKTFTSERLERSRFLSAVQAFRNNWIGENDVQARYYPLLTLYIAISTIFLISCNFVYFNTLTIGQLVSTNLLLLTLIDPTNTIFWATNDMMSGFAACSRIFKALSEGEPEKDNSLGERWPKEFKGKIEFKNVSFSYEDTENMDTPVLENLNFTIEPKQTVALIGPTGCGKSHSPCY